MSGDVIKEFLVGLGFKIDEAGMQAFGEALGSASLKAAALGTAVVAAGAAVFAGVQHIAEEYYQLDRLATQFRTTAEAVDEFADIGKILGLSEEQTIGGLKALDRAISDTALGMGRAKLVFAEMGIEVLDAGGKMKPTTEVMDELALKFKDMERGKAMRVMERLGLDPSLLKLFNADLAELRKELAEIDKAAGFDLGEAIAESKAFTASWKALKMEFEKAKMVFDKLIDSIAVKMMPKLRASIDQFKMQIESMRRMIMENMDKIRGVITRVLDIVFRAVEFVTAVAYRIISVVSSIVSGIISLWGSLDDTTQNVILGIVAIGAAWKFLNLSFLATPIGQILALAAAIALLVDDFLTWREGGDSLIDWAAWEPAIDSAMGAIMALRDLVGAAFNFMFAAVDFLVSLLTGDFSRAWFAVGELVDSVINIFMSAWNVIKGIGESLGNFAGAISKVFGGGSTPALTPSPQAAAAVTGGQQHVSQKTEIIVQGSTDPAATGKAVAGEQGRVNGDMARNMKGAAR